MTDSRQGIGLLGGSFNPVHNGHLAIAQSFLASSYIAELWILLTPDPPHKKGEKLNDYESRLQMLQAAFQHIDRVKISDVENELPRPSYTVQTLEYLTENYPDAHFYLCLGEDSVRDFKQWKDWEKILDYCKLLVARRPSDSTLDLDSDITEKAHFVSHQPVEISSTAIRDRIAKGEDISALVPESVEKIIKKQNLYTNQ